MEMNSVDPQSSSGVRYGFYQAHLNRVSRSFAFCIARLEPAFLREQVGLSYLICRILDTIEDAAWKTPAEQYLAFEAFNRFLVREAPTSEVRAWMETFPPDVADGEKLLLADAAEIFSDFHRLPEKIKSVLKDTVDSMSAGMKRFVEIKQQGRLRLSSLVDVNRYCFFVAGVVGEVLTRVLTEQSQELEISAEEKEGLQLFDAFRFGLFLQKVNLLKDQKQDEKEGRFLVPSRFEVLMSLRSDAGGALRYLLSLPKRLTGYRLFCGWSLFLGLASIPWLERAYHEDQPLKISRGETQLLLGHIEQIIGDNKALSDLFEEMLVFVGASDNEVSSDSANGRLPLAQQDVDNVGSGFDFASLYRGLLSRGQVEALFAGNRV